MNPQCRGRAAKKGAESARNGREGGKGFTKKGEGGEGGFAFRSGYGGDPNFNSKV